jgi:hypothetical protein
MPDTELPIWRDFTDHERMSMIAYYRHWFLFPNNGQPKVVKRRKVFDKSGDGVRELMDEEVCDLYGTGEDMSKEARAQLQVDWSEYTGWKKAQR